VLAPTVPNLGRMAREISDLELVPHAFTAALAQLRSVEPRPEIELLEAPAPAKLAPHAVAITADLYTSAVAESEVATGRFVLLYDPAGHDAWEGEFRCVTFVRAELEFEMGDDPLLPEVGWSWLMDALKNRGVEFTAPSGTVTRVSSEAFGQLAERDRSYEIEIRASWTAFGDFDRHLEAWCDLISYSAGLPPLPEGVSALTPRKTKSVVR